MGFAGINMANMAGGINASQLFEMGQQAAQNQANFQQNVGQRKEAVSSQDTDMWTCQCGKTGNTGKFCEECGAAKPEKGWKCSCGTVNTGKFCMECGAKKPVNAMLYKCDKCGWQPKDPAHPPKFCPECGDIFDENDIK